MEAYSRQAVVVLTTVFVNLTDDMKVKVKHRRRKFGGALHSILCGMLCSEEETVTKKWGGLKVSHQLHSCQ